MFGELVIIILILAATVLIMIKLSELSGRLGGVETRLDTIDTKVDALLLNAGDPALPADAEAKVVALETKAAIIDAKLPEVT